MIKIGYFSFITALWMACALLFAQPAISAETAQTAAPASSDTGTGPAAQTTKVEIGRFSNIETAKAFLLKLTESGYIGGVQQQKDSSGQAEYQVYLLLPASA
ncbi:MAG: hypothetical protein Q8K68_04975, partial [Nitrospirota bacterium]|nr:hypothetical protein [Nitrospirota bacterium]